MSLVATAALDEEPARFRITSNGLTAGTVITVEGKPLDLMRAEWVCDASAPVPTLVLYVDAINVDIDIEGSGAAIVGPPDPDKSEATRNGGGWE